MYTTTRPGLLVLAGAVLTAGCAPMVFAPSNIDTPITERRVVAAGHERMIEVDGKPKPDALQLTFTSRERCEERLERTVHRREIDPRRGNIAGQVVGYIAAGLGLGLGATVLGDSPNIPPPDDLSTRNPVGRTGAYAIGGIAVGLGAGALALGVGTSLRGRTTERDLGTVVIPDEESRREIECNRAPLAKESVVVVVGDVKVELGRTDASGVVLATWERWEPLFGADGAARDKATVEVGSVRVGDVDLAPARRHLADLVLGTANRLAADDKVDEATAQARHAAALGADTKLVEAEIEAAPTSVRRRQEVEKKVRAEREQWENQWGACETWMKRPANRVYVQEIRSLFARQRAAATAQVAYEEEKGRNDGKVVAPSIVPVPLYPETTGTFTYIQALNQFTGEAVFEATDGRFVLRLSAGHSFSAAPGDPVHMTMHSRGERMPMTNGQVLPVFHSGPSPLRVRSTRGYEPSRARERQLQQRAEAAVHSLRREIKKLLPARDGEAQQRQLRSSSEVLIAVDLDGDQTVKDIVISDDKHKAQYCIAANGRQCSNGEFFAVDDLIESR